MRSTLNCLLVSCALLSPWVALAAALPADGGDPGKAYRACLEAVAKPSKVGIVDLCFAKNDPWLAGKNLDYFDDRTFVVEVRQVYGALQLVDVAISGGQLSGDQAVLQVAGKRLLQRQEPTGDIVEVSRSPAKGTVSMVKAANGWRPSRSDLH
ncbi:MAG: hypothetical protein ABI609_08725 [Acidobacteriota bacterium]